MQFCDDNRPRRQQSVIEWCCLHSMSKHDVVIQLLVDDIGEQAKKDPREENVRVKPILVGNI